MTNAKHTKKNLKSKTNWDRLHQAEDAQIDYSDIPVTTDEFWKDAKVVMPLHKVHLSLRLDQDIVDYFKKQGQGYQSKINAVLKTYVLAHLNQSKRSLGKNSQ